MFCILWSEMTKLVRVDSEQLKALRGIYANLSKETETALVRVALEDLIKLKGANQK